MQYLAREDYRPAVVAKNSIRRFAPNLIGLLSPNVIWCLTVNYTGCGIWLRRRSRRCSMNRRFWKEI